MPMKHYVMKFDLKTGKIRRLEEFDTIDGAFARYHEMIDEYVDNPDISIKLLEAQDRVSLIKLFGSFFHNCSHHDKHSIRFNYKCKENPPGSGNFKCPDTKEEESGDKPSKGVREQWAKPPSNDIAMLVNQSIKPDYGQKKIYKIGEHDEKWAEKSEYVEGTDANGRKITIVTTTIDPRKCDVDKKLFDSYMHHNKFDIFPHTGSFSGPTQPFMVSSFFNVPNGQMPDIVSTLINDLELGMDSYPVKDKEAKDRTIKYHTSGSERYSGTDLISEFIQKIRDEPDTVKEKAPELYDAFITRMANGDMDETLVKLLGFEGKPKPIPNDPAKIPIYKSEPIFRAAGKVYFENLRRESRQKREEFGEDREGYNWDDDEFSVVTEFKANSFKYMNAAAVGLKELDNNGTFSDYEIRNSRENIEEASRRLGAMDRALDKGSLPMNVVLYRGVNEDAYNKYIKPIEDQIKPGTTIEYPAYMSTSLSDSEAKDFAGVVSDSPDDPPTTMVMRINAQKGTKGAYLDADTNMREYEWLLPRNSKFKITGKEERIEDSDTGKKTRRIYVDMEVV